MDDLTPQLAEQLTASAASTGPASVAALASLPPLVYEQMRQLAHRLFRRERGDHTLQPTALVHEAWVRVADLCPDTQPDRRPAARARFLGIAAHAMRQVLVEHARARGREKRGGAGDRVTLGDAEDPREIALDSLLDLQAALQRLHDHCPNLTELAELRLFAGLSVAEAAETLGISLSTCKNRWLLARTMIARWMAEPGWMAAAGG